MGNAVNVVVLYNESCPATPQTVALINRCAAELEIPINVREAMVSTQGEADAWRFLGSPTVQVNGLDIDPGARASKVFGFM